MTVYNCGSMDGQRYTGLPVLDLLLSAFTGLIYGITKAKITWESFTDAKDFPFAELQDVIFWSLISGFFVMLGSQALQLVWYQVKKKLIWPDTHKKGRNAYKKNDRWDSRNNSQ